jgi:hypothetical protein
VSAEPENINPRARALWARTRITVCPEPCMLVSLRPDAPPDAIAEAAALAACGPFSALIVAPGEISLTVPAASWRASALRQESTGESGPYVAIALDLTIELDVTGYLAPAAARLAAAGIPIVPQCAYLKDYLLVREADRDRALAVLEQLIADCSHS